MILPCGVFGLSPMRIDFGDEDANKRKEVPNTLKSNGQAEMRGYHASETLAERETYLVRHGAFRIMASVEKHHDNLRAGRIRELQGLEPVYASSKTGRLMPRSVCEREYRVLGKEVNPTAKVSVAPDLRGLRRFAP